jgi:hypothetical protein
MWPERDRGLTGLLMHGRPNVTPFCASALLHARQGPLINSRLSAIVLSHLRQQHRAACLASQNPISTLPPVSLLRPYALPVARRELEAPRSITGRVARREAYGGRGGRGARAGAGRRRALLKARASSSWLSGGVGILAVAGRRACGDNGAGPPSCAGGSSC